MSAEFTTPVFHVNAHGWGPTTVPEQFVGIPFTPFGKGERLGRIADFVGSSSSNNNRGFGHHNNHGKGDKRDHINSRHYQSSGGGFFGGNNDDGNGDQNDDADFELVDTIKSKPIGNSGANSGGFGGFKSGRSGGGGNSGGRGGRNAWGGRGGASSSLNAAKDEEPIQEVRGKQAKYLQQPQQARRGGASSGGGTRGGRAGGFRKMDRLVKDYSVKIQPDWKHVESFDLAVFSKMTMNPPKAADIMFCGSVLRYNEEYERVTVKNNKPLHRFEDVNFFYVSTLEDPVIESLIEKKAGNVFCTDELMAYLMTCTRTQIAWDIIFTRVGNMLFIDKRDGSNLEVLTVNETASNRRPADNLPPVKPYNEPDKLRIEATAINQNFLCQVLSSSQPPVKTFESPNPFVDDDDTGKPSPVAYRYRKWQLGENTLVARTEVHGVVNRKGVDEYMTLYALNEWDPKLAQSIDWRQKIDTQRGAILATELKNNAAKLGRWTAQTLISGADVMKIGFVSRLTPADHAHHAIIATQFYNPKDFAVQINLSQQNMWGVLKAYIDFMMKQPPGKYILMRDPNSLSLKIYEIPMNSFEDDEDEDEDGNNETQKP